MPIYEYECESCGAIEEVLQKISERPLRKCRHCTGKVHKLISQSSFHLKGTGWYVTDYTNKGKKKTEPKASNTGSGKADTSSTSASSGKSASPAKASSDS